MNHNGDPLPSYSHDFAVSDLAAIGSDVVNQGYGDGVRNFGTYTGVSLRRLITTQFTFPVESVEAATFACTAVVGPNRLSPSAGDFADPTTLGDAYPFVDDLPPLFALGSTGDPEAFEFVVNARKHTDAALTSGADGFPSPASPMTLTLQLQDKVLAPTLTAEPSSVKVGQVVTFHADVTDPDSSETLHWTWDFDDGATDDTDATPSTTHTYTNPAGGDFTVKAHLVGDHGSSGEATASVNVEGTTTTPTSPTTPPTGTSHGAGGSIAPTDGPRTGDGPRDGGVATNRPGTGAAGPTYAAGSASATASPTASGDAPEVGGVVVGYLLSNPTGAAVPREAAPKAIDDSAAAARNGVTPLRWGWIVGVVGVVALLALGAGSERRRPLRARRRR